MMGALLAGMAGGYVNGLRRNEDKERQDKIDAREEARFAREKKNWDEADRLKSELEDAAAPLAMEKGSGGMIKPEAMDNRDVGQPENAALPNGGLMQGSFKVGGKSFVDQAAAQKELEAQNSADSVNQRMVNAYRKNGLPEKALSMQNAVMDSKLKSLGLTEAEGKHADAEFNRQLLKEVEAYPDWTVGAAKALTNTKVGGLDGYTVTPRLSNGGKTVDFFAVGQDGQEKKLKSFANNADGRAEFLQNASHAPIETKIGYVVERARAEKDDAYKRQMMSIHQSQESRANDLHKIVMADAKVPAAVKLQAATLSEEMKSISNAINKARSENTFDPNSDNAKNLIERQAALGIQYRNLLGPHMPAAKDGKATTADPLEIDMKSPAKAVTNPSTQSMTAEQYKAQLAANDGKKTPVVSMREQLSANKAPLRTIDGGKTYTLDIPETIRDPSVKYYREIPNPAFLAIGNKSFGSAAEAKAAFEALQR